MNTAIGAETIHHEKLSYNMVYRLLTACDYLQEHKEAFDVEKGFKLLASAVLDQDGYTTLCSMMFTPESNQIYIALDQQFDTIWQVSLDHRTIIPCRGFDRDFEIKIDDGGILASDMPR